MPLFSQGQGLVEEASYREGGKGPEHTALDTLGAGYQDSLLVQESWHLLCVACGSLCSCPCSCMRKHQVESLLVESLIQAGEAAASSCHVWFPASNRGCGSLKAHWGHLCGLNELTLAFIVDAFFDLLSLFEKVCVFLHNICLTINKIKIPRCLQCRAVRLTLPLSRGAYGSLGGVGVKTKTVNMLSSCPPPPPALTWVKKHKIWPQRGRNLFL